MATIAQCGIVSYSVWVKELKALLHLGTGDLWIPFDPLNRLSLILVWVCDAIEWDLDEIH
jgi:hypothetical protein